MAMFSEVYSEGEAFLKQRAEQIITELKEEEIQSLNQTFEGGPRMTVLETIELKSFNQKIQAEARMTALKEQEQRLLNQKIQLENEKRLYEAANEKINFYLAIEKYPNLKRFFADLLMKKCEF